MNVTYLKMGLSIVEILIGIVCIGISSYLLIDMQNCNPNADFCKPIAWLWVILLMFPGVAVFVAGIVSYSISRITTWKVQVAMIICISLYYISIVVYISTHQN